jgi:hypothetical protein
MPKRETYFEKRVVQLIPCTVPMVARFKVEAPVDDEVPVVAFGLYETAEFDPFLDERCSDWEQLDIHPIVIFEDGEMGRADDCTNFIGVKYI